jgi:predicted dehydrogenase
MMRAAVIGAGAIGRHHARVYHELDGVELVAVADPDEGRRTAIAGRYHARGYADHIALLEREAPDVVSVAVPTASHHEVALAAIERGVHLLVEKPIAATVEQGREILDCARARGVTLTVGHVERYNPAVSELQRRLARGDLGQTFQIHARRLSPFPHYVRDVGVVIDLATHELDVMRFLMGRPIERVYAESGRNVHEHHEDTLSGMLRFADGMLGVLDINWITPTKIRELRLTGERGMFLVDYLNQDLTFFENGDVSSTWDTMALFRGIGEGNVIKIRVPKMEPLRAELQSFLDAVSSGTPPLVSGEDGLWALALAELLIASAAAGRPMQVAEEIERRRWCLPM